MLFSGRICCRGAGGRQIKNINMEVSAIVRATDSNLPEAFVLKEGVFMRVCGGTRSWQIMF